MAPIFEVLYPASFLLVLMNCSVMHCWFVDMSKIIPLSPAMPYGTSSVVSFSLELFLCLPFCLWHLWCWLIKFLFACFKGCSSYDPWYYGSIVLELGECSLPVQVFRLLPVLGLTPYHLISLGFLFLSFHYSVLWKILFLLFPCSEEDALLVVYLFVGSGCSFCSFIAFFGRGCSSCIILLLLCFVLPTELYINTTFNIKMLNLSLI